MTQLTDSPHFQKQDQTLHARLRRFVNGTFKRVAGIPASSAEGRFEFNLIVPKSLFGHRDRRLWESECRRLNFNARLAGEDVLCRAVGRYRMVVNALDEGLAPNLIADGFWEIWISALIARAIQPGMVCLDIGANIGYYTVIMADQAGPEGKVIAAEPMAETFSYLRRNVQYNNYWKNVEALNVAFGAEKGVAQFYLPKGEPKNATMAAADGHLLDPVHFDKFQAPVWRVDDLELPKVDFVKIDVEGAERLVWQGMAATIARSPDVQIVMEVNAQRPDLAAFLDEITQTFPLRTIDALGYPTPIEVATIMADPEDVMLYLSRS